MTRLITKGHAIIRHPDLRRRSIPPSSVKFRLARKILVHYMKTKDKAAALRHFAGCLVFDQSTSCLRRRPSNSADVSWMNRSDVSDYVMAESSDCISMDEICEQFSRMKISDEGDWEVAADFDTPSDSSSQDASFYSVPESTSVDSRNASPFFASTPHNVTSAAFSASSIDIGNFSAHEVAKILEDTIIDDLCDQFSKLSLNEQEEETDWCTPAEFDIDPSLGSSGFSATSSFDFHKASLIVSSTPFCAASASFVISAAISLASVIDLDEVRQPDVANVVDDQVMKRLREPSFTLSFLEEDEWHTAADVDASLLCFSGDVSLSDCSIDNHGDVEDNSSSEPEDDCDSEFFDMPVREMGGNGIRTCKPRFRRCQVKHAKVGTLSDSDSVDGAVPWAYKARWSTRPVIIVAHSPIKIISDSTDSIPGTTAGSSARVEDASSTSNPVTGGSSSYQEVNIKGDGNDEEVGNMSVRPSDDSAIVNGIDEGRPDLAPTFASNMFSNLRKWFDPILAPFSSSPSNDLTKPEKWQVPPPLFFSDESESSRFISSIGYPSRPLPILPVFSQPRPFYDDLD
ncbi:hypothetical protein NLI96_g5431 [Meripilus lineatus]|uniref:Uncharacterized protein n=1 Tax=Meripilus lineatus TaxID=2056292 RepID=A0AAD5V7N7_9APHY|nr:hypothetical protein NLI96_g5431 [Physisporinus lineatus]